VADPASVARWADGVLMVTQAGVSTKEAGRKATELLDKVGAHTIGVVVWGVGESGSGAGRYGDYAGGYYYYSSYYSPSLDGVSQKKSAKSPTASPPDATVESWVPKETPGRRLASIVGKTLTVVLAFLVVLAIAAVVGYLLDQYFGWGMSAQLSTLIAR